MKIAIPIYNGTVSNVFDFAHRLLLVDIRNGVEENRSEVSLTSESFPQRARRLGSLGVGVVICGAISRPLMSMLTATGIEVLPYVTGGIDEVLQAYITGRLSQPQFITPGGWPGARRGFGRAGRRCRRRGGRQ